MGKILVESSQPSSATHRLTQPSTTRDRRSIRRPSNLAIEEASHSVMSDSTPALPSRLVNLRVTNTELEAARAAENARREALTAERIYTVTELGGSAMPEESSTPQAISSQAVSENLAMPMEQAVPNAIPGDMVQNMMAQSFPEQAEITPAAITPVMNADPMNVPMGEFTGAAPDASQIDTATLMANIATDYAAASMGAIAQEMGANFNASTPAVQSDVVPQDTATPVDDIAQAAAEAIASIRIATEPSQISEQLSSLRTFADNIKSNQSSTEMRELGDTIEKFINVAMKSSAAQAEVAAEASSNVPIALTPKVARAANKVEKVSAKAIAVQNKAAVRRAKTMARPVAKNNASSLRTRSRKSNPDELKDQAIERALNSIATMNEHDESKRARDAMMPRRRLRPRHVLIALSCATACVGAILYFVGTNIPDISVQVAAMQTGIQASYPSYVPRDYSLDNVMAEDGKIVMKFIAKDGSYFTLTEEKSSWDSATLLRNYVEPAWKDNYTTTHEQGITIYINNSSSDAAWMNGGVLYKITSSSSILTKKQVRNIVVSL